MLFILYNSCWVWGVTFSLETTNSVSVVMETLKGHEKLENYFKALKSFEMKGILGNAW